MPLAQPTALIKEALSATVTNFNKGLHPTKALTKAAQEYDLNPNYIQRVGEAFNVALALKHFKTAAHKEADYHIAVIPEVVMDVFGDSGKTASEQHSETFTPPILTEKIPNYEKVMYNPRYKRAQQEIFKSASTARTTKFEMTKEGAHNKCIDYIRKLKNDCDVYKTAKVTADYTLQRAFSELVNHFSKTSAVRTVWHEIESQAFSKHGELAESMLDLVYKTAGMKDERGAHEKSYTFFNQCKEAAMFDKLMVAVTSAGKADEDCKIAQHNYDFEKSYYHSIFKQAAPLKKNTDTIKVVAPVEAIKQAEAVEAPDEFIEKFALNLVDILSHRFSDSVESKNQDRPNPLANTSGDDQQRKMVLQELIMTDPILSKEQPQKVVSAYQQILRVAPELSKEKDVVRSILREMLATQSLNPHTSNMLTEADLNLMKQKLMRHGGVSQQGK